MLLRHYVLSMPRLTYFQGRSINIANCAVKRATFIVFVILIIFTSFKLMNNYLELNWDELEDSFQTTAVETEDSKVVKFEHFVKSPRLRNIKALLDKMIYDNKNKTKNIEIPVYHTKMNKTHQREAPRKLIIVAYMRGGSSLTGELFNQHEKSFYVYEPLRSIQVIAKQLHGTLEHLNGTKRAAPRDKGFQDLGISMIRAILNCNLEQLDIATLKDVFFMRTANAEGYFECLRKSPVANCVRILNTMCEKADVRVIKTIRLHLEMITKLVESDPNAYIVHLVRDPRAIVHSRVRIRQMENTVWEIEMEQVCLQMSDDIQTYREVKNNTRILQILYENLAYNPQLVAKQIYNFVNLKVTNHTVEWIDDNTKSEYSNIQPFALSKGHSKDVAVAWKKRSHPLLLSAAEDNFFCQEIFKTLGYERHIRLPG